MRAQVLREDSTPLSQCGFPDVRSRNRLSKNSLVSRNSRRCLLKRVENLAAKQAVKLKEPLTGNPLTVHTYLLKEQFHFFWEYASAPGPASSLSSSARQRCTRASNR